MDEPTQPLVVLVRHINNYLYELRKEGNDRYANAVKDEVDAALFRINAEREAAARAQNDATED